MKIVHKCDECNKPGGTIPKHNSDGSITMLHDECAQLQRFHDMVRESQKN